MLNTAWVVWKTKLDDIFISARSHANDFMVCFRTGSRNLWCPFELTQVDLRYGHWNPRRYQSNFDPLLNPGTIRDGTLRLQSDAEIVTFLWSGKLNKFQNLYASKLLVLLGLDLELNAGFSINRTNIAGEWIPRRAKHQRTPAIRTAGVAAHLFLMIFAKNLKIAQYNFIIQLLSPFRRLWPLVMMRVFLFLWSLWF